MAEQPPVRRPCYAWRSSPADVEGEGWQGSTLQSTLALSFTMPFLPCWLCLRSYLVFGRYFMLATGEKEIMCGKKKWLALENTLSQEFGKLSYFPSFIFLFFPFLSLFSFPLFLFLFIDPPLFPPLLSPLLFFKDKVGIYQMSITCSAFFLHP